MYAATRDFTREIITRDLNNILQINTLILC